MFRWDGALAGSRLKSQHVDGKHQPVCRVRAVSSLELSLLPVLRPGLRLPLSLVGIFSVNKFLKMS